MSKAASKLKEEKAEKHKEEIAQKEIESCTFAPQIEPSKHMLDEIHIPKYEEPIEERAQKYMRERMRKIEENEKTNKTKLDDECTFKPKIDTKQVTPEEQQEELRNININSIDKYLERMTAAKENKEKIEKQWTEKVGSGANWKYGMTIPEAPKLAQHLKKTQNSSFVSKNQTFNMMDALNRTNSTGANSFRRHQNYPQTVKAEEVSNTKSQAKLLLHKKNQKDKELITLDAKCDFDQAQWIIHSHIQSLDV